MLVTADEETGSASSRALIESEALASKAVLVLEPALPGGALKTSRKGCGEFVLRAVGRAAHAGVEAGAGRQRHQRARAPDPPNRARCRIRPQHDGQRGRGPGRNPPPMSSPPPPRP